MPLAGLVADLCRCFGRVGLPEDFANVVAFLVSEKASCTGGEALNVNGAVYID